jgi:hypothetical protein
MTPKIFGIGLPKTGTSTLGRCFEILGYSKAPYNLTLINQVAQGNYSGLEKEIAQYQSFEDWPWPVVYPYLLEHYPEAKFILTLRADERVWLKSLQKHTSRNAQKNSEYLRQTFFGSPNPWDDEETYLKFYRQHIMQCTELFKDKPQQLLLLNWEDGDNWPELCDFLQVPIPNQDLPHVNPGKSTSTMVKMSRLIRNKIKGA